MEAVTRAFYARGDLDLVLSSPAAAERLFAVRIGAMAVIGRGDGAGPWRRRRSTCSPGAAARNGSPPTGSWRRWRWPRSRSRVIVTIVLFAAIGPKRTRLVAQIIAAVDRRELCDRRAVSRDPLGRDAVARSSFSVGRGRRSCAGKRQHAVAAGLCGRRKLALIWRRRGRARRGHAGRRDPALRAALRRRWRSPPAAVSAGPARPAGGAAAFARHRRRRRCAARSGRCCAAIRG